MTVGTGRADRMGLAVTAAVAAILAREAEAHQQALAQYLQPMRQVIEAYEGLYGQGAQPMDHPRELADLVARFGAAHLRERDVQLLRAAISQCSDRQSALTDALAELDEARTVVSDVDDRPGGQELLAWVGVSKEQFEAAVTTALRHR